MTGGSCAARERAYDEVRAAAARDYAPLDRDAERALVARAQGGDGDAEDALVRSQTLWVAKLALARCRRRPHLDPWDAYGVGLAAVLRCVRAFKPELNTRLITVSKRAVTNALLVEDYASWPGVHLPPTMTARSGEAAEAQARLRGSVADDAMAWRPDRSDNAEAEVLADAILDRARPDAVAALVLRFGLDGTGRERSLAEVARVLGEPYGRVKDRVNRALAAARRFAAREGVCA